VPDGWGEGVGGRFAAEVIKRERERERERERRDDRQESEE